MVEWFIFFVPTWLFFRHLERKQAERQFIAEIIRQQELEQKWLSELEEFHPELKESEEPTR